MSFTKSVDPLKRRRQEIKIWQRQLGLDDATYRDTLERLTGKRSSTELSAEDLDRVLAFLQGRSLRKPRWFGTCNDPAKGPMTKKVWAMLVEAGRGDDYIDAMAKRMFGRARLEWCTVDELHRIVSALVIDQQRRQRDRALGVEPGTLPGPETDGPVPGPA